MKYRKKPVVIEAIQLKKNNILEVFNFIQTERQIFSPLSYALQNRFERYRKNVIENGMIIETLEDGEDQRAKHVASIGDYIIKGVKGEFYPCKPDIFEMTYEPVND